MKVAGLDEAACNLDLRDQLTALLGIADLTLDLAVRIACVAIMRMIPIPGLLWSGATT
ncbi:hypothetical protein SynROS8604_01983 [Synechococcus sp. ROS8604]|nr:hypothetical protein SynROS8604_01983 [Synechococcus sp. ROS8604]